MLLELEDVHVHYGAIAALKGLSATVDEGEIVTLLGANGAGKTTTLKTVSGLRPITSGRVLFEGRDLAGVPAHERVQMGISQAPEGRGIFPGMTIVENLEMGAYTRTRQDLSAEYERVFHLFPRLEERRKQQGGTLSGGEQQMLAIGRALMAKPRLLLLDEPSLGLAPKLVAQIFTIIHGDQPAGHHHPARGAERRPGPPTSAPRLRPRDRPPRQDRRRQGPPQRRLRPSGLPRRRHRQVADPNNLILGAAIGVVAPIAAPKHGGVHAQSEND